MFRRLIYGHLLMITYVMGFGLSTSQIDSTLINDQVAYYERGEISLDSLLNTYYQQALSAYETHDFASARSLLKTHESLLKNQNTVPFAKANMLRAHMAMEEDDRVEAIELLNQSLEIFRASGDSTNYLLALKDIGINYDYMSDHSMALIYYTDCIDLAKKLGRLDIEGSCLKNIGGIYSQDGDQEKAISYYDQSISLAIQSGDSALLHRLYHGLGLAYRRFELFNEAYKYHLLALQVAQDIGDLKAIGFGYQGLGFYYFYKRQYDSAEYYMDKTLKIANQISNDQLKSNAQEALEQVYYSTGRYKQAYDTYRNMVEQDDSLYTLQNTQLLQALKEKYQNEKRDRELAEKNLQLQEAGNSLIKQRNWQMILVFVVIILLLILFLIYRGYVLRQRANTILRTKNAEIEKHLAEIEDVTSNKNRWFVNVAHELRTPLTLIKGPIQRILKSTDLSPDMTADLKLVERNTKSLSNLVNEILDLSKMVEGDVSLHESVFELDELVNHTVSAFDSRANQLGIQLKSQVNVKAYVLADREKLNKVLVNLISNALKFTSAGGLVEVILAKPVNKGFRIIVKDTGRGIVKQDLTRVFDRFFQSSGKDQEVRGGTGIGLALSKEIAEMHGGELKVTSTPGMGSTFTLTLPEEIEATRPPFGTERILSDAPESSLSVSAEGIISKERRPLLLLLEDNEDMASYIASLLQEYFDVKVAKTGLMGLEMLGSYSVKFIISDIMMPEMDGVTFLKKVKSDPLWKHLPFIHLTALSDESLRKELLRIGIDDYLMKPFDAEELIIRVRNLYMNYQQRVSLDSESVAEEISYDEKVIERLKREVLNNIEDTNFNVLRMADGAALSERQLYRFLKATTGLTPLQFIQEIKLNRANELARKKVYGSISELAMSVGFKQPAYFSSLFEKRFGKKPSVILKA